MLAKVRTYKIVVSIFLMLIGGIYGFYSATITNASSFENAKHGINFAPGSILNFAKHSENKQNFSKILKTLCCTEFFNSVFQHKLINTFYVDKCKGHIIIHESILKHICVFII